MRILVLHGANLNMLGVRQPQIYGKQTLDEINSLITAEAAALGVQTDFFQSNHEGALIDRIHAAYGVYDGIVINPGSFTHYSYGIMDALAAVALPTVEVHLSDIYHREDFRRQSVIAPVCLEQIAGLGTISYIKGLRDLVRSLRKGEK